MLPSSLRARGLVTALIVAVVATPLPAATRLVPGANPSIALGACLISPVFPYWHHHDGLGSVVDVTGNTGSPVWWSEYYPYGLLRRHGDAGGGNGAPAVQPFTFTGEQLDSITGLYHMRARQYDSEIGRFLTTDPLVPSISDPYVGAYIYARNNPTRFIDPSGELPFLVIAGALMVSGALGYLASNTAANVVDNAVNDRPITEDVTRGLTAQDTVVSAAAGLVGGPISGVRTVAARSFLGAGLGAASSVVSQELGGRSCPNEARFALAGGALTAAARMKSWVRSGLFGALVSAAQGVGTYLTGCGK
jgi:RHS repeat-associated protein